ncbi:MAG: MotA/TolQ/ExbB proton channel family protein [Candidatus Aureabacteria bacterium]|nr:MotA/TolQ/ExbB proton channel family protein [Candidatus Auribacterota bacterium]
MNSTLIQTFVTSDIVGQIITLAIVALSIVAWFVILDKIRYLRAAEKNSQLFLQQYRKDRNHLFSVHFPRERASICPFYKVYEAGMKELKHHMGNDSIEAGTPVLTELQLEEVEDAVQRAISDEMAAMERMMILLAITAVVGPLMGLLGTVWGIMNAFNAMAAHGSPSLLIVAPGIAGALITTVVGLLVAIPSVGAYNIFLSRIRRLSGAMEDFASEFVSAVRRRLVAH